MKRGWFGESHRHYLAAKGYKTKYYSAFGDIIRGAGTQYIGEKEKYLREAPTKETTRAAVQSAIRQQAVVAAPLTEEEQRQKEQFIRMAQQRQMKLRTLEQNQKKVEKERQAVQTKLKNLETKAKKGTPVTQLEYEEYVRLRKNLSELNQALEVLMKKKLETETGSKLENTSEKSLVPRGN